MEKPVLTYEAFCEELEDPSCVPKRNQITQEIDFSGVYADINGIAPEDAASDVPVRLYSDLVPIYSKCNIQIIQSYLSLLGNENKYNPVITALKKKKYDGKDHLTELFDAMGVSDDELSKILIKKWLWQGLTLLHNTYENFCAPDGILVLTGKGGIGKTQFFRHIADIRNNDKENNESNFFRAGQKINSFDKDTVRRIVTTWIAELGELDVTIKQADASDLKNFITCPMDEYRLPYGKNDIKAPRRTNLGATINVLADGQYLVDQTGNRRYWTVNVDNMDYEKMMKVDSLQVWLQVWEQDAKNNPQGFRLTTAEGELLGKRNGESLQTLPGEDEVLDIIQQCKSGDNNLEWANVTITEFIKEHSELSKYSAKKIGVILDKLGYLQVNKRVNGKMGRYRKLPIHKRTSFGLK